MTESFWHTGHVTTVSSNIFKTYHTIILAEINALHEPVKLTVDISIR